MIFMLVERNRIRRRFLGLVGHSRVATTTLAIDEAGSRISSFLLVQLQINSGFALLLGIGLYLIGIPNAMLWAVLTLALRFLPYVGVWISAFFTLALAIAISTTWREPILVAALYAFLELFTNNVVEPFALAGSTGISPLAVIVSALFWTWLWGLVGLLLSTPLTACLVALGRYFPAFYPCSILLAALSAYLLGNKAHSSSNRGQAGGGKGAHPRSGRHAALPENGRRANRSHDSDD